MDIKKFAVEEIGVLHLRDANDELMYADGEDGKPDVNKPMRWHGFGPGSKKYAAASAKKNNRVIDKLKKKGKADQTADEQATENAEFLCAVTESFENVDYEQLIGEAKHKAIFTDQQIGFVAEQVGKHLGEWGNFSKGSAKS